MWKKAATGRLSPIAKIISPNWLVVENAIIFLISCWVIATVDAKKAVNAPSKRVICVKVGFRAIIGDTRIRRNTPATTIVEL